MTWPLAFALTLAVEVPIYALGLRRRVSRGRAIATGVVVNLVTHPVLWFGLRAAHLTGGTYVGGVLAAEVVVVLIEGALVQLLCRVDARPAIGLSAIANAASFLVGLLIAVAALR